MVHVVLLFWNDYFELFFFFHHDSHTFFSTFLHMLMLDFGISDRLLLGTMGLLCRYLLNDPTQISSIILGENRIGTGHSDTVVF